MLQYSKKDRMISRTVAMIIGILLGVLLLVLGSILTESTVATIIHIGLIIYGIVIIIGNIPGLVSGVANIGTVAGKVDLVCSVLGIVLGMVLIFYQGSVLVGIVAAYLILFPLLRVLLADQKMEQLKREAIRIVLGVVLLVFVPSLVGAAFTLIHLLLVISGWVVIALSVLFGVIELVRLARAPVPAGGSKVYVDTTGDGKADVVYMDTTGDGKVDTAVNLKQDD